MTWANTLSARAAISAGKLKIETGLNYRANEAAINGESCLDGVRVSSREGDELHRAQQDADADASGSSQ